MLLQNEKTYKRKLISSEAVFIHSPGAIVGMVAKVLGYIDDDIFKYAVEKLSEIYPILKYKLTWDKDDEPYFEETKNYIPVIIVPRHTDKDFEKMITDQWERGFDLTNGPLCKFILLKSHDKSEIIFVAHHTITDGISATMITDFLLKIMDNPNAKIKPIEYEELPSIENLKKYIPKANLLESLTNKSISSFVNYSWKKNKVNIIKEDIKKAHKAYFDKISYIVSLDELSAEDTFSFINKCKKNNVTVNSALSSAFLACRREIDNEHISKKIVIPVDLRKYLGNCAKKSIGCYSTSIDINFTYEASKAFWENAKIFNKLSSDSLNNFGPIKKIQAFSMFSTNFLEASTLSQRVQGHEEVFKSFPYAKKLGTKSNNIASIAAKNTIKDASTFTITNLGVKSYEYNDFKLESLIIYPSSVSYPEMNITLSVLTINAKLILSYHMLTDKAKTNNCLNMLNNLKENIHKFIVNI